MAAKVTSLFRCMSCRAMALPVWYGFVLMLAAPAVAADYSFTTLAGVPPGGADGPVASAQFSSLVGVAVDGSGNIYVAESTSHTIRKISGGVVSTFAGLSGVSGSVDDTGSAARFNSPQGLAVDSDGNVYVADALNHKIRKITPAGVVTTFAGSGVAGAADAAVATDATFNFPCGVAVDSADNVYVADTDNHKIRKITPAGVVTTFAGTGNDSIDDGDATLVATFSSPRGITVDGAGIVYVADSANANIRKIESGQVVTIAGSMDREYGNENGTGLAARFRDPSSITVGADGDLYVTDTHYHNIRKITSAGVVTTLAGSLSTPAADPGSHLNGTGSAARFDQPRGVVYVSGNLYVTDTTLVRGIDATTAVVTTFAGGPASNGAIDGTGSGARFSFPQGAAFDTAGAAYVADTANNTIRKITSAGVVTTFAGLAGATGSTNGTGDAARFNVPVGVAVDSGDNVYVADSGNKTIRKISPAGDVTTFAGLTGSSGSADGTGTAARFSSPAALAVDGADNLYVADVGNHNIRKITPAGAPLGTVGAVTTVAGLAGTSGTANGTGTAARFNAPSGIAVDLARNLYVADTNNHAIRKITPAGDVTTMAGLAGTSGVANGTGATARFLNPVALAVDRAGTVFVADTGNFTIRRITFAGVVTTLAGTAGAPGSADGTGSIARFNVSRGLAVDASRQLVVADTSNNTIRFGIAVDAAPVITVQPAPASQTVNAGTQVTYSVTATDAGALTYQWRLDGNPIPGATNASYTISSAVLANVGSHDVVVSNSAVSIASDAVTLAVNKLNQTITFGALADATYTTTPISLAATASSSLSVAFSVVSGPATVDGTNLTLTGVGTVVVRAAQAGNAIYNAAPDVDRSFTVTKATATVNLGSLNPTYDGSAKNATATTTPADRTVTFTYDGSPTAPTNAGSYAVVGTISDANYEGSASGTLVIGQASQTITFGTLADRAYTTTPFALTATASSGLGVSYAIMSGPATVSGANLTITGVGTITVRASQAGNGNYAAAANVEQSFTVTKATATVTLGSLSATYDGNAHAATATTNPASLPVDFTYDLSATAPTNAGSYAVVGTINHANYEGSASGTLVIGQASQTITFGPLADRVYTTTPFALTATASSSLPVTYAIVSGPATLSGGNLTITGVGTVTVRASQAGNGNFNAAPDVDRSFEVTKATATVTLGSLNPTYDGSPKAASATTSPSGRAVNFTYDGSATAPTNAGSYAVVGTISDANYEGSASGTLVIAKATGTVNLGSLNPTYDGSPKAASATTNPSGRTVNFTYDGSATAPTNAGSYAVVGTISDANYEGSASGTLVIGKATATVTLGSLNPTYDGSQKAASATTSNPSGLTVTFTYDGSPTAPTIAGSYAVVGTISDANYQGSASGTLVIGKATATVNLGSLSPTYDGNPKVASATTSTPSGLTVTFTYDGSATAPTNAGSYAVVGTISDTNYQGSASGTLVIAKATGTVTLGSLSATYDGSAKNATATTTPAGRTVTFTYDGSAPAPTNAGSYAVVGTIIDANYQGSASGTLVISTATGTVTLGNLSATYDGSPKAASATTNPSGRTVTFTYDGSATVPTNAGSYAVVGTISDANYQGSASGTLVIAKATATVTLGSLSATYDGSAKNATATTTPTGRTVTFTYDGSATAPTNAGSYAVVGTISETNYQGSASGTLVIVKATATVTLGSLSPTYDGSPKAASATTSPSGRTVTFTYDGSATAPTNAGSYAVVGTISDTNYQGGASGTLVIGKATATVTLGSLNPTYDGSPKAASATTSNPSGLTVTFTYNGSATAPTNAGSYTVVGTISDTNYQGSASGTLVIAKATGTVTLGSLSPTYDGSPKAASATTNPSGRTVTFTYDGSPTAPTNAGSYAVVGTINDANYQGNASGTLVIAKATATVTLGSLNPTYDGSQKAVSATTSNPSGLTVNFTYDGSPTAPTNAGSYAVVGTISHANYQGSASGTLVIAKAAQTITFAGPGNQAFSTTPIALVATAGSGLSVSFSVLSGPATVTGDSLTLTGAGDVTVRASQAGDTNRDAAPVVDRTFTAAANVASWRQARFTAGELLNAAISGPNADPDADGYVNLLEYALGLEPKSVSTVGLPTMGTAGSDWVYVYIRPASITDVTYVVEISTNLTTWTTVGVTHEFVSTSGGTDTWRAKYPLASATNVFFRLRVTGQ